MRRKSPWILNILTVVSVCTTFAQANIPPRSVFLFYNTENLFDCFDDTLSTGDDDFTPNGNRHWHYSRYKDKLSKIAKVILASGEWTPPSLVGLCEIENQQVMHHLTRWTGLYDAGYRFIHFESPDHRGIDVALLYNKHHFRVITTNALAVTLPNNRKTRDILMVKGILHQTDTLFVFVNHWPSRLGGEDQSRANRMAAANTLIQALDSLTSNGQTPNYLVMGDFNDGPLDPAIRQLEQPGLVNLTTLHEKKHLGSNKYKQDWELIDQILMSKAYLNLWQKRHFHIDFSVVQLPFLLEKDDTYLGIKPFRTYVGPAYKGGFSDHLPVKTVIEKE
jgi:endonuclease/exonuclease/phosphatase family metal-dependent hydrolase